MVGKATPGRSGPRAPDGVWGPDQLVIRCSRESQQRGPPDLRLCSSGERERHNADGHKSGDQYIAVLFGLQPPLTHKLKQIKGEIYFFKEVFARPLTLCRCDSFCMNLHMSI